MYSDSPRAGERLRKGGEHPIESHVFGTHERVISAADGLFGGPNACSSGQNQRFFPPESPVFQGFFVIPGFL
jgi:hypothetical protein